MTYFIAINASSSNGTTFVSRTGQRIGCISPDRLKTNPEFAFPNEHSANLALVEATNILRQRPVEGRFDVRYKLNLLKRMNYAEIVSVS